MHNYKIRHVLLPHNTRPVCWAKLTLLLTAVVVSGRAVIRRRSARTVSMCAPVAVVYPRIIRKLGVGTYNGHTTAHSTTVYLLVPLVKRCTYGTLLRYES